MPIKMFKINVETYQPDMIKPVDRFMQIVNDLKSQGYILTDEGLYSSEKKPGKPVQAITARIITRVEVESNLKALLKAGLMASLLVKKTSARHLVESYGLKHKLEKALSWDSYEYISNGHCILVMLFNGYGLYKYANDDGPNCKFSCKYVESDFMDKLFKEAFLNNCLEAGFISETTEELSD